MIRGAWTREHQETAERLWTDGKSLRAIARSFGCTHKTVRNHLMHLIRTRKPQARRWTDEERSRLLELRFLGRKKAEIARELGRSVMSVDHALRRHRQWVRAHPEVLPVLRILEFCLSPTRVLRAARDANMLDGALRSADDSELARLVKQVKTAW